MKKYVQARTVVAAAALAVGAVLGVAPAYAQVPQVNYISGHEVRWTNGCFEQFNFQGQAMYISPECNDKKTQKSQALVNLDISLHKGKKHDNDDVDRKGPFGPA